MLSELGINALICDVFRSVNRSGELVMTSRVLICLNVSETVPNIQHDTKNINGIINNMSPSMHTANVNNIYKMNIPSNMFLSQSVNYTKHPGSYNTQHDSRLSTPLTGPIFSSEAVEHYNWGLNSNSQLRMKEPFTSHSKISPSLFDYKGNNFVPQEFSHIIQDDNINSHSLSMNRPSKLTPQIPFCKFKRSIAC